MARQMVFITSPGMTIGKNSRWGNISPRMAGPIKVALLTGVAFPGTVAVTGHPMEQQRSPHDPSYKQFFSHPEMVTSLLRDFVPEAFVAELDFSTLEICSGEHVTDDLRERHDDLIWRLRWKDSWLYVYLILEFQSSNDPWMAVRILGYTALLWQDLIKSGAVREGENLPPVLPVVIYNGRKPWTAAQDVAELLPRLSSPLSAYQPRQKYFLLDEGRVSAELLQGRGLVAQLVRLEQAASPEAIQSIVRELVSQLKAPRYRHLRRMLSVWLGRVVLKRAGISETVPDLQDLQEIDAMLEERVAEWKDEYIRQGVLIGEARGEARGETRGRAEGEAKGLGLALRDFLEFRFGSLPVSVTSRIAALSDAAVLRRLTLAAYQAESLQAVVELLQEKDALQ